jgi:threonine dehydrogenase-like Zn-dependent dehydrogenase
MLLITQKNAPSWVACSACSCWVIRIYNDEITIIGSMAVLFSFQAALDLISSGVITTEAMLTGALPLQDFSRALDMVRQGQGVKTQILPNA